MRRVSVAGPPGSRIAVSEGLSSEKPTSLASTEFGVVTNVSDV